MISKKHVLAAMLSLTLCASVLPAAVFGNNNIYAEESAEDELMTYKKIDRDGDRVYDYISITSCTDQSAEIVIPDQIEGLPVENIGEKAFKGLTNLETITIPDTIEQIEQMAFYNCSSLANINFPDKYVNIDSMAFSSTKWFNSRLSDTMYLGKMLYRCPTYPLSRFTVKEGTIGICEKAFYNKNITEVILPESLEVIDEEAFLYSSLKKLDIPGNLRQISERAFYGTNIEKITVDEDNKHFFVQDNILYDIGKTEIQFISNNIISCEIPDTVTEIPEKAFAFNKVLNHVKLPAALKIINDSAFKGCESLAEINLPDGLEEIGRNAFDLSGLTEVTIPSSTEKIGAGAFFGCTSLDRLIIGEGTTGLSPELVEYEVFYDPGGCVKEFKFTGPSFNCITKLYIPKTLRTIGQNYFDSSKYLTDVYFDGTREEYSVLVASGNDPYKNAALHFSDGEVVTAVSTAAKQTTSSTVSSSVSSVQTGSTTTETTVATDAATDSSTAQQSTSSTQPTTVYTTAATTQPINISGDADLDGVLTARDAAYIASKISQGKKDTLSETADYNGDGVVNVRDAAAIAKYMSAGKK
ncbi:MAG: leucine-rich repeat protein [Porcipelethomonas sp.]